MAVANYHDTHGCYPPAYIADVQGRPMHSWRVLLLPYLDQQEIYQKYDFSEAWNGPHNRRLADQMPAVYALHGADRSDRAITNYLAVLGPETVWPGAASFSSEDVSDELSATILIIENVGAGVHWMEPRDLSFDQMSFRINSPSGVSSKYADPAVVMLDGSLHRLRPELTADTLRALLTAGGGEKAIDDGSWSLLRDGRDRPQGALMIDPAHLQE